MDLGKIFGHRTDGLAGLASRRRQPQPATDLQQDAPTAATSQTPVPIEPPAPAPRAGPPARRYAPAARPDRAAGTGPGDRAGQAADIEKTCRSAAQAGF